MISFLVAAATTATITAIEAFTSGALLGATLYSASKSGKVVHHRKR